MKEYETMRVYHKRPSEKTEIAPDYYEIPYTEYRADGSIKATGTEDFTFCRFWEVVESPSIFTWDGERRNKGGHRWFDYHGFADITKGRTSREIFKKVLAMRYNAKLVELRK